MATDGRKPDLARIKQAVSFPALMSRYNLNMNAQNGDSYRGKCPLPTHTNEKDNNSFTATCKDKGWVWDCFSSSCIANRGGRKGGNIIDFTMLMENEQSLFRIGVNLNAWFGLDAWLLNGNGSPIPGGRRGEAPRTTKVPAPPAPKPAATPSPAKAETGCERNEPLAFQLRHIDFAHPYLKERGITPETAEYFGVGYFPGNSKLLKGRIVIPIWNAKGEGNPVAYAGRAIGGEEPKYVFPPGFKKSLELFNLHRVPDQAQSVVVVEGFFDCLKVWQAGVQNVVALMGSSLSDPQERLLAAFPLVTFMLDGDEAGYAAAREITARRSALPSCLTVVHLKSGEQPDMLPAETIRLLLG